MTNNIFYKAFRFSPGFSVPQFRINIIYLYVYRPPESLKLFKAKESKDSLCTVTTVRKSFLRNFKVLIK